MWWAPEYACCRDAWWFQGDWTNKSCLSRGVQIWWDINSQDALSLSEHNSGETDEANCSWLHPIWPPPRRPDRDSTIYVVNRTFTKLILCINRVFDVRDSVFKPHCIVESVAEILAGENRGWWGQLYWGWSQLSGRICGGWRKLSMNEANSTLRRILKHSSWLPIVT